MINNNTDAAKMNSASNNDNIFDVVNDQYIETPWNIIESYFKGQHLDR
jgi:hypothetical protein